MAIRSDDTEAPSSPPASGADPAALTLLPSQPASADMAPTLVPSLSAGADAAAASLPSLPGYEILSELGRGGMGAVFRGRDPDLGRELAVKVLLERHQDNPLAVERFLEEAQVGGQLQHPGVVPVYEAGRLPDDRPYFTMKLVEGRTLEALLKERDTPARDLPRFLQMFQQICQTLAYAHSKGVIHRDLKPANVMVGAFGELQVMDWGLAKVVRGRGVRTVRSETAEAESEAGSVVGTPAYMAPEQACGDVEGLDERCDVFGLGAILCEVLTGSPPYRGRETGELLRKAARADLGDAFARLDGCGVEAELVRLAKACLAAEPADRPADGGAVTAAMTAYLAGVQERLRKAELERAAAQAKTKAGRRARKMTVALAATLLLAVTAVGAGALWYQHDRAARAAEDARLAASRAAEEARLAAEHARKAANTERDVTTALEEAAVFGKQAAGLHADPAKWEAALVEALSAVKRADGVLNSGEGGEDLRARVDALRAELEAADKDRRMIARLEEASFHEATAVKENGFDNAGAAALYAEAFREDGLDLTSLEAEQAADRINRRAIREELLAALADWSNRTSNEQDEEKLRRILQAADPDPASFRNRWNAALDQQDWDTLQVLAANPEMKDQPTTRLATMAREWCDAGDPEAAVNLLKDKNERRPGDFWINYELAYAHANTKPPAVDEAIRYYTAALALRPSSPSAHVSLGNALDNKGQRDEAIAEYRKALQIQPDFAEAHNNLGVVLKEKGQLDEAIAEFRKAMQIQPDFALAHTNLGHVFSDKEQWDEAIAEYRKVLQIQPDDAKGHTDLGGALSNKGQLDEGIAELRRALQIQPDLAEAHYNLGITLNNKGQLDEAIAEFRKALQIQPNLAEAHYNFGDALTDKGLWDEAIAEFRKALQIHPDDADAHYRLGGALSNKGQLDEAVAEYRKALQIRLDFAEAHYNLGVTLNNKGQLDEAVAEFRKALQIRPDFAEAHNNLGNGLANKGQWDEAIAEFRKALQIQPDYALARNGLGDALDLAERDAVLPTILRGEAAPSDAAQQVRFADFCREYKRLYATASRFYADAFTAEPGLAKDLSSGDRYDAACAAALAGCGQGEDAPKTDAKERSRWRNQALDWLRADLALWTKKSTDGKSEDRADAAATLSHWQEDSDLAGVRDKNALAKLPADEQDAWRQLWTDVDALLKKAQEK
jgi:tetratricopeptide (TPR) repeat protein